MIFSLKGRIPSKKNSKQIIRVRCRPIIISSSDYIRWEKTAVIMLRGQIALHKTPVPLKSCHVWIRFIMPDKRRRDLSNSAESVMDALVKAGIIEDDCWQVVKKLTLDCQIVNKDTCGAEITITPI